MARSTNRKNRWLRSQDLDLRVDASHFHRMNDPKSLSLASAAIEQIVVIMRDGNESQGYGGAPDGRATGGGREGIGWACRGGYLCRAHPYGMGRRCAGDAAWTA